MIGRIQSLFAAVVARVEGSPTPLARYAPLFGAILAVRLCLEFFSSHRLYNLADVLHIGLWFLFIVLAFLMQLHLFSGEDIRRVIRLVVVGFTIALTAPILDLLFSGGEGAKMNYLSIHTWQDVLWAYITVGGSSLSRGATLGIRIEIMLLVLASFNYVWIKTHALWRALAGALTIYTVLFLSGTVPKLLGLLVGAFGLTYGPDDQSTLLLLLCLDLLLLAAVFFRLHGSALWRTLRATHWPGMLMAALLFAAGARLAYLAYPGNWVLNPTRLFHFPLHLGLLLTFAVLLGRLKMGGTGAMGRNVLLGLLMLMGYAISERFVFVVAVLWGLLFFLYESPLRLITVPLLRQVLLALLMLAAAMAGFVAFGGPMVGFPVEWIGGLAGAAFLAGLHADTGREGEELIPWFATWGEKSKKIFVAITSLMIVLAAGFLGGMLFGAGWALVFAGMSLPAALCNWVWPGKSITVAWLLLLPLALLLAKASLV